MTTEEFETLYETMTEFEKKQYHKRMKAEGRPTIPIDIKDHIVLKGRVRRLEEQMKNLEK